MLRGGLGINSSSGLLGQQLIRPVHSSNQQTTMSTRHKQTMDKGRHLAHRRGSAVAVTVSVAKGAVACVLSAHDAQCVRRAPTQEWDTGTFGRSCVGSRIHRLVRCRRSNNIAEEQRGELAADRRPLEALCIIAGEDADLTREACGSRNVP